MKTTEIAVLGAAALAVYLILRTTKGSSITQKPVGEWAKEVFSANGTPFSNGWRYYTNGTAISPNGEYYFNGQKVWAPT